MSCPIQTCQAYQLLIWIGCGMPSPTHPSRCNTELLQSLGIHIQEHMAGARILSLTGEVSAAWL